MFTQFSMGNLRKYKEGSEYMYNIVKTDVGYDITLTRGDSLPLQLTNLKKNDVAYTPDPEDAIRFAMKRKYKDPDEDAVLVKSISPDTLILSIDPEDTKELAMGKTYVYDIQITDKYGFVATFIEGNFTIGNEVL